MAGTHKDDQVVITLAGGIISPAAPQESIRLDLVDLRIFLRKTSYVVDSSFRLFNTGETALMRVGAPKHGIGVPSILAGNQGFRDFTRFGGWVNDRGHHFFPMRYFFQDRGYFYYPFPGEGVRSDFFPGQELMEEETIWMMTEVRFPGHALTTIRIKYAAHYVHTKSGHSLDYADYYFGPGVDWKGKIQEIKLVIERPAQFNDYVWADLTSDLRTKITRKKITGRRHEYELKDLEPLRGAALTFGPVPTVRREERHHSTLFSCRISGDRISGDIHRFN